MNDMQKMVADIEAAAAKTRELMSEITPKIHIRTGDTTWWKRIPRTDNRVADLAGFLRWAKTENRTKDEIEWVISEVFSELSSDDVAQARQLA